MRFLYVYESKMGWSVLEEGLGLRFAVRVRVRVKVRGLSDG